MSELGVRGGGEGSGPYQLVAIYEFNLRFFGGQKREDSPIVSYNKLVVNTVDDSKFAASMSITVQ